MALTTNAAYAATPSFFPLFEDILPPSDFYFPPQKKAPAFPGRYQDSLSGK
ncbi:MAG: hypothetical protein IKZ31_06525 [Lentisphaeria bacterium]|nr:hypothetical protein [Lentisphaeria bacterium]